jgi:MoaD family protein
MSRATVRIPAPLRSFTGGADEVGVEGATVADLLADLARRHAGVSNRILDERGEVRPYINVFLGGKNVRGLGGLAAPVAEGDIVAIIPAVAGGGPVAGTRGER